MKRIILLCFFIPFFSYPEAKSFTLYNDTISLINSGELIRQGVELHKESKYDEAIAKFLMVPESDTNFVMMRSELVNAYLESAQYEKAIEISAAGIKERSEHKAHFYATQGMGYDLREMYDEAIQIYKTGLQEYPNDYYLHYNLGVSLFKKDEQEQATDHFIKAITLNPFHGNSHLYLGDIMVKQGKKSRAMMCFGTYLALVPGNNKVLVLLNGLLKNSLSYENTTPVEEKVSALYQLDLLVKSNAALDKKFKSTVSFKAPVAQQTELLLESVKEDANSKDFWMRFYVPFYAKINQSNLKQVFVYHILTSVDDKGVKKWLKSNKKELDRFFDVGNQYLKNFRAQQTATVGGETGLYSFWYYDNHTLNAIGNQKDDDNYYGPWVFYHQNGELMAEGVFLPNGKKTGKWNYYYPDGQIKKREEYDANGIVVGSVNNYYESGKLMNDIPFKGDKVEGVVKFYYPCGQLKDEIQFKDDQKNGAGISYYTSGQVSSKYSYKDGEFDGTDTYYYKNGDIKEVFNYTDGQLNGAYQYFRPAKVLSQKGQHKAGEKSGEWIGYFEDGSIDFKGSFLEGKKSGVWNSYYPGGKILSTESFDEEGNLHGKSSYFREDGGLHFEYEYKKGILTAYKYFNQENQLIGEAADAKGNLEMKGWYPDGKLYFEGNYKKGKKTGEWVYYFHNGFKSTIIQFEDDQYHGAYLSFYETGQKKISTSYTKGVENGLNQYFYKNGKLKIQGWVVDGASEQSWISYFPDGVISNKKYFLNDELHGIFQEFDKGGRPYLETRYYMGNVVHKTHFDTLGAIIRADAWDMGSGKSYLNFASKATRFEYEFQCNEFSSDLKTYYKNGALYAKTPVKYGDYNGRHQSFYPNKKLKSEGDYEDDEQVGLWTWYYESGKVETKLFVKDGEVEGERLDYYENGQLSAKGNFKKGIRTGSTTYYAPDGTLLIEKEYDQYGVVRYRYLNKDNKLSDYVPLENYEGVVKAYFPNGKVSVEQNYKREYLDGKQLKYYPSGQLLSSKVYKMGEVDGIQEEYHENGKLRLTAPYKDGEVHGQVVEYYPSGTIKRKTSYLFDEKEGWEEKYDMKGKLISKEFYRDDYVY